MTPLHRLRPTALALCAALAPGLPTQDEPGQDAPQREKAPPAYPGHDILSPFRNPEIPYAPPDAVYRELRAMRGIAERAGAQTSFDEQGREICDSPAWRDAHERLQKLYIDLGYLAQIVRRSGAADDRATAFYGALYGADVPGVLNLISHIPGEPVAATRERVYVRAIAYLRAHVGRRWGDLSDEQKEAAGLPDPGSPAARAMGITRAPRDDDYLFNLNLRPFFQLLDLESESDQAQGLWFLKELFRLRGDLIDPWLERAVPRVRELLHSRNTEVRSEAIEMLALIDPQKRASPERDARPEDLDTWADEVLHTRFPPLRRLSAGLLLLRPSKDRDALVAAGLELMRRNALGEATTGQTVDGQHYRGFRVARTPAPLDLLGIPEGAVITTINGQPIHDGPSLLKVVESVARGGQALIAEYVVKGEQHAMEFRFK